ncbi:Ap-2 complex subunit beta [Trypanosoma grayi]|uniref:AP complex subunit beta n=1 Tax=Trypanosoma grayi TaxID=71804 RepID=M4T031_9TRYP|nr:Ap-2 complex subunit beta [Trypanosoma grayi]AGH62043.1 Ap-2 complex subunit beta [Trypanosoma grayi]KEG06779.1 Ap-2 complex subunit beta [Trypanosoma grayi]
MLNIGQLSGAAFFNRAFDSAVIREDLLSQNVPRQLSALQQVLAFMTIGRDMSGHFSDIAPLCSSTNLTIKRLVYLYLMHNSRTQPQKAVLQAGTFVKDTLNDSPLVRGAALRTMTSLLVPVMVDFITTPLQRCLEDTDPYVRRIAALGTLKLYYIAPNVCEEVGLLEKLKDLLQDENACVVASTVAAILELRQLHAPAALEEAIVSNISHVLEAADAATGWYQHYLIEGVAVPFKGGEPTLALEEATRIVDRVLPFLSCFNVATAISAVKVVTLFLLQASHLWSPSAVNDNDRRKLSQLQERYGPRVASACVSLLYCPHFEVRYAVLRNVHLLLMTGLKRFFKPHLSIFFVKYDDPIYIKLEKAEILLELADVDVGELVLSEFATYATDADEELVRKAVRSIGFLAAKVETLAAQCVEKLVGLIDTGLSYVVQDAAVVVRTVLRRYPDRFVSVVPKLCDALDELSSPESKSAVLWVLGEYAERVEKVKDILDIFVESFSNEPRTVQLALLTAVVKMYLRSTSSAAQYNTTTLEHVLKMATHSPLPDIRDRAFMYWRLISNDREAAKKIVLTSTKGTSFVAVNSIEKNRLHSLLLDVGDLTSVLHRPLHLIYGDEVGFDENDDDSEDAIEERPANPSHPYVDTAAIPGAVADSQAARSPVTCGKEAFQVALTAEEGSGLEVRMSWSQLGNKLLLNCRFSLVPGEDYTRSACVRMLQINRNIFGLGLAQECSAVFLELGQKEADTLHLQTGTNNQKSTARDLLVAINADPVGTRYFFAPPVPPAMLLLPATGCDANLFAEQFRQLKTPSWTMPPTIKLLRTDSTRYTTNALRLYGLSLVYTGEPCDSGIQRLFLYAETIAAQKLFMEVSILHENVVYIGVRCSDKNVSPVFGTYTMEALSATDVIEL